MKRYAFPLSLLAVAVLVAALATFASSQTAPSTPASPNTPAIVYVSTDPSGSCTMNNTNPSAAPVFVTLNVNTGLISRCKAGTWVNGETTTLQIGDGTDPTKLIKFAASGASTATTLTLADTLAASRTVTFTDPGGNANVAYANPTTAQALTGLSNLSTAVAGTGTVGTAANPFGSLIFGTAATNNVSLTSGTQAAARTINVPDYGLTNQNFPGTVFLTGSAYTNATTTLTNVTGLAFPVAATTNYTAHCSLTWQGSAGTTGPKWTFTGPGSPTAVNIGVVSAVTGTTLTQGVSTSFGTSVNNAGTITTATNFTDYVDLQLINGANAGTVQLQAAANGTGTLTVQPGSWCRAQ
jgi:hypothetical protein